jgi:type III restriction enzyme
VPTSAFLQNPQVQAEVIATVKAQYHPLQGELEGITPVDVAAVVAKTTELVMLGTIDIPRILVLPRGEVRSGFNSFQLQLSSVKYQPPSEDLWIQHLRTHQLEVLSVGQGGIEEDRLEDYVVSGLVDFDDISYDDNAELLYDLAGQVVEHFRSYLSEMDTRKVLQVYQRQIADFIHVQMQAHYWEQAVDYEVKISKGFSELKPSAYTAAVNEQPLNFLISPSDKSNMAKYLFGGFKRCLYPVQKFQSDPERRLAVILDRESEKWFRPAKGQFQIFYKSGVDHLEYQPDFVAETSNLIYMLEPKASNQMNDTDVLAKQEAALKWCKNASDYADTCGGKKWTYALIPHDIISENMTLTGLVKRNSQFE